MYQQGSRGWLFHGPNRHPPRVERVPPEDELVVVWIAVTSTWNPYRFWWLCLALTLLAVLYGATVSILVVVGSMSLSKKLHADAADQAREVIQSDLCGGLDSAIWM